MKKLFLLISAIFLLLTTFTAYGFGGGKGYVSGNFWGADLNRNEFIDREEAKHVYNLAEDEIFNRYDQDGNDLINFTEFSDFMMQSPWTKPFITPNNL